MGKHLVIWRDNLCNCGFDSSTNWTQLSASSLPAQRLPVSSPTSLGYDAKGSRQSEGFSGSARILQRVT